MMKRLFSSALTVLADVYTGTLSHSCLKLTLDDGSGENRVIVSSIKSEYTCEQLVGKKIIVIANLEPARFSGVQSNGML